jgi:flavin-dependent dehydrogenase
VIDLVIVGGGPAGLATALHAARAGLQATVLEPRPAPIDKACGEGLMPPAVAALRSVGVRLDGVPLHGIRYLQDGRTATAEFRSGTGLGVRRTELHTALHRAVQAAGVPVLPIAVGDISQDGSSVQTAGMRARYLVAADGLHSGVRRAQLPIAPWTDHVEVHWAEASEAYVTPVGSDCVGVAVLGGGRGSFADRLAPFDGLRQQLDGVVPGPALAAGPMRQPVGRRVHGRVLLVGDAAGYVDALTGEGLAVAFACAEALVSRVVRDEPHRYERDYLTLSRRYRLITGALLWAARRTELRRRIVPAAARLPWLFEAVVGQLAR